MVDHPGEKLEDIPVGAAAVSSAMAGGSAPVEHFASPRLPAEPFQDDRAADHVAAQAHGARTILHLHGTMHREAAVAPGQEV